LINFDDIRGSKTSNLFYLDENNNLKKGKNEIPKIYKITENNFIYEFMVANFHTVSFIRKIYVITKFKNNSKNVNNDLSKEEDSKNNNFIFEKKLYKKFKDHALKCGSELCLVNIV